MIFTLKDDNTTGMLYLCCLFYVFSMIVIYIYIYKSAFIYNFYIYRWCNYEYVAMSAIDCYFCSFFTGEVHFTHDMNLDQYCVIMGVFVSLFVSL